jgi:ABC-type dipeptide/oligopeptide/nickel transport system ATPase subunit
MNATTPNRQFAAKDAKREHVPLLIGLTGPSGGGKTFSALRLATGIQTVTGGDIYFIDTESRRALHYADQFKFKHVTFGAPFGSLDYLAALKFCVNEGAKVVIVDSMSHEHEGPGGMVDLHDQIALRMSGGDAGKLERVKMLAWSEPKQKRRTLINGILQLNANFIFCFRAKNTSKPVKGKNGRTEVEAMGFMPIAGEEFVFEQTLNALLLPGAGGVPTWSSEAMGERTMIKLPEQFHFLRDRHTPLDENVGAGLARWAAGLEKTKKEPAPEPEQPEQRAFAAEDTGPTDEPTTDAFGLEPVSETPETEQEPHPAEAKAAAIIAEINDPATNAEMDVTAILARHEADIAAMPGELGASVEIAADKRRNAIRKEQDAAKVREAAE